ncbi:hypothetical protein SCHPADRAFT_946432 [Schizopora paradoxa]|uniref:Uncharacterized protein n=1 Tax=Schizopora paradoxa TaxID=27342 RepID=A0A0H2RMG8_9AGAM|nr:hypothetical protein SCHPADRAFT_946432 [Schizopora paradoxa]
MTFHEPSRRIRLYTYAVSLLLFLNACALAWFSLRKTMISWMIIRDQATFSYIGNDSPRMLPVSLPDVLVTADDFVEYELYGEQATKEWGKQVPRGNGVVRLGAYHREFVVAGGHELHCLLRLVKAINIPEDPTSKLEHSGHCLNYIRERILCDADLTLEPFELLDLDSDDEVKKATPPHICKDWTKMLGALHDDLEEWEHSEYNLVNRKKTQ